MEKIKYYYYVSYFHSVENGFGMGAVSIVKSSKIKTNKEVLEISELIKKEQKLDIVSILNWNLLRIEKSKNKDNASCAQEHSLQIDTPQSNTVICKHFQAGEICWFCKNGIHGQQLDPRYCDDVACVSK